MRTIDWNEMSRLGLIQRINTQILHPMGLAISRTVETGASDQILIAEDGKWEYSEDIKSLKLMTDDEIKKELFGDWDEVK